MDQHRLHPQRISHQTGMLARRPAKGVERVFRHIIAALNADLLDRIGHVLDGDGQKALGHLLGGFALGLGDLGKARAHHIGIERRILVGTKDAGEKRRPQLAQHDIGVRHRQRPAAPIAGGAGVCPGTIRPHAEPPRFGMQDRATARRHGIDPHHRRADAHARHLGVKGALIFAREMGHIGRGAAHVETDDAPKPRIRRRFHHADHAARRAGQDRILALKPLRRRHPARRHHELQRRPRRARRRRPQRIGHPRDVAAQDRREIGIDHRGVAAPDQLDQRADLVTDRDLGKAHAAHQLRQMRLMRGVFPRMHQDNGHRLDPIGARFGQWVAQWVRI